MPQRSEVRRILIDRLPFGGVPALDPIAPWNEPAQWPCRWVALDPAPAEACAAAYRCSFELATPLRSRIHVTADESYELYLDGVRVGHGSEHGDRAHWYFDTYEVELSAGSHTIAALVQQFGRASAAARVTVRHGFLCAPEDSELQKQFGTGVARWQAASIPGIRLRDLAAEVGGPAMIGPAFEIDLRHWPADWWASNALPWSPVKLLESGNAGVVLYPAKPDLHLLRPATLPPQRATPFSDWTVRGHSQSMSAADVDRLVATLRTGSNVMIPAGVTWEVLLDSNTYLCAESELELAGGEGARIEIAWAEMIRMPDGKKGSRDNVDGAFRGLRDVVIADGTRRIVRLPVWRPGRYLQVHITTAHTPLTLHRLTTREVGYPFPADVARWNTGDDRLDRVMQTAVRTLRACAHDTFMDCPFYEQLQYIGDVQIQSLVAYCLSPDVRLARKAIELMLSSRHNPVGLPMSAHPSKGGSIIAPFALALVGIVHDFAMWRSDRPFVAACLPALRGIVDWFLAQPRDGGLVRSPFGWNFIDANLGQIAPGGEPEQTSGLINWQLVVALNKLAELEAAFGESELAQRASNRTLELASELRRRFYDPAAGRYRDSDTAVEYSEHGQILPLLSGCLDAKDFRAVSHSLANDSSLKRTGASYTHLLFETYHRMGRGDLILQRLKPWTWAIEQGFKTFPEYISLDTRSDCHGWSAHPLFHYYASLLGIRPATWGFEQVTIAPNLGGVSGNFGGTMAHPKGLISVTMQSAPDGVAGTIELPPTVAGEFVWKGERVPLTAGANRVQR